MSGHRSFETAIGRCAIVWQADAVMRVLLPGGHEPAEPEGQPPSFAACAIAEIIALLDGRPSDFGGVPITLDQASAFEKRVYEATSAIPRGETRTYGALAVAIGDAGAARAVGVALGRNPVPVIIPCHRVLGAGGTSGGFTAPRGLDTKFSILRIERAGRPGDGALFADLPLMIAP